MKRISRILSIALCFALLLTVRSFPAFASVVKAEYTTENAVGLLSELGVIDSGYKAVSSAQISREFFVQTVIRLMNIEAKDTDLVLPFDDVAVNDASYASLAFAFQYGLISGNGDRSFRPQENITISEATKILSGLIGYGPAAEGLGGYPSGYLVMANRLEITDGVSQDGTLSAEDFIHLLYNTLLTDVYEQVSFGNDKNEFRLQKGENPLKIFFDVEQSDGIVTANADTSLVSPEEKSENRIEINEVSYRYSGASDALLGRSVVFFYRDNGSQTDEIIFLYADQSLNKEIVIQDEDLLRYENGYLYYDIEDTDKEQKERISDMADVIYNGKAITTWKPQDIFVSNGRVTLLDNNNDNAVDVIFIESYMDYVVSAVGSEGNSITFKFNDGSMDLEDKNCKYKIMSGNLPMEAQDIKAWDVLSVAESHADRDGKSLCTVLVTRQSMVGTVEELSVDKATLNGKEYSFITKKDALELKTGLSATFYLNTLGKLVACKTEEELEYAYVRDVTVKNDLEEVVSLKLLTTEGNDMRYPLADKASIDGNRTLSTSEILSRVTADSVIRFSMNEGKEITYIDTANEDKLDKNDSLSFDGKFSNIQYRSGALQFVRTAIINTNTKIFFIPDNEQKTFYTVGSASDLISDLKYTFAAYDMTDTKLAKVLVVYTNQNVREVVASTPVSVVERVSKRQLNGEEVVGVQLMRGGISMTDYWIDPDDTAVYPNPHKGDIIQITDSNAQAGKILSVRVLYTPSEQTPYFHKQMLSTGTQLVCSWGEVKALDEVSVLLNISSTDETVCDPYNIDSGVVFYIYDTKDEKVKSASFSDVKLGDKLFFRENYYDVQECVIIR